MQLIQEMARQRWTPEAALADLMCPSNASGLWLRRHRNPKATFARMWRKVNHDLKPRLRLSEIHLAIFAALQSADGPLSKRELVRRVPHWSEGDVRGAIAALVRCGVIGDEVVPHGKVNWHNLSLVVDEETFLAAAYEIRMDLHEEIRRRKAHEARTRSLKRMHAGAAQIERLDAAREREIERLNQVCRNDTARLDDARVDWIKNVDPTNADLIGRANQATDERISRLREILAEQVNSIEEVRSREGVQRRTAMSRAIEENQENARLRVALAARRHKNPWQRPRSVIPAACRQTSRYPRESIANYVERLTTPPLDLTDALVDQILAGVDWNDHAGAPNGTRGVIETVDPLDPAGRKNAPHADSDLPTPQSGQLPGTERGVASGRFDPWAYREALIRQRPQSDAARIPTASDLRQMSIGLDGAGDLQPTGVGR